MDRAISTLIKLAIIAFFAAGAGRAAVFGMKRDAKSAMSMGLSYGKFNRQLQRGL